LSGPISSVDVLRNSISIIDYSSILVLIAVVIIVVIIVLRRRKKKKEVATGVGSKSTPNPRRRSMSIKAEEDKVVVARPLDRTLYTIFSSPRAG